MTLDEWFDALAATREKFHWELIDGKIRTMVDGVCMCPIMAVYADSTGTLAHCVIDVPKEHCPPRLFGVGMAADGKGDDALRRRMLDALGLEAS